MKSRSNLLCAIEDRSGAGFHTKQPLNVGQPIVSQVVIHQTTKAAMLCWIECHQAPVSRPQYPWVFLH